MDFAALGTLSHPTDRIAIVDFVPDAVIEKHAANKWSPKVQFGPEWLFSKTSP
jgi:hypothetical protein